MKVYYATSSDFKHSDENNFYDKTVNYIGFKVGQKNLKVNKYNPVDEEIDTKKAIKTIKYNEKALRDADVFIADMTKSSAGLGFQIALATSEKKPTLVLRHVEDTKPTSQNSITSGAHRNITYTDYKNTEEITKSVDLFLEDAKQKIDTKFILIIPPEIDKYLNWASDFRRLHKAQVVRQAIEKEMSKDKDWKSYLRSDEY